MPKHFLLFILTVLSSGCGAGDLSKRLSMDKEAVPVNDSIVTGKIISIHSGTGSYILQFNIIVDKSEDVAGYPNETKDKIGTVITVHNRGDIDRLRANETVTLNVRLVGNKTETLYEARSLN